MMFCGWDNGGTVLGFFPERFSGLRLKLSKKFFDKTNNKGAPLAKGSLCGKSITDVDLVGEVHSINCVYATRRRSVI